MVIALTIFSAVNIGIIIWLAAKLDTLEQDVAELDRQCADWYAKLEARIENITLR